MNEMSLKLLHELIEKTTALQTPNELEALTAEYAAKLETDKNELVNILWNDIKKLGSELISLRSKNAADKAVHTEQELLDLEEVIRVINENLFDYHFQPIIRASDGEIYSYEALMRPKSSLCPSPFHILKYAGLTNRLDDVERATFMNILAIIDEKEELFGDKPVFINSIPRAKLTDSDTQHVNSLLKKHSGRVVVEMTEQSEMSENEFGELKETYRHLNVRTAIDDYGAGYSTVKNLLKYMPDYVKIDRSLLSDIQNDDKKQYFVRDIIEFCHANGILALAEGVETAEELRTVIHLGADLIQGYYTARPSAEVIQSLPYELKQEIKHYRQEREEGRELHIYTAASTERILLSRLTREEYNCIIIGRNGSGDVTISGSQSFDTRIHIEVVQGFKGCIMLEDTVLSNEKDRPCIDIGEDCDVRIILSGSNRLRKGGIRVPESSQLTISGEGRLSIYVDGSAFYAIGNDVGSRHGELIFEQGITIDNHCADGICIGSGLGGRISIRQGQFAINMTGYRGIGIGAFFADTEIDLFACDITMDLNFRNGAALGTLDGNVNAHIHSASTKLYMSGSDVVGIGTVNGKSADIMVYEASVLFDISALKCSAAGALEGNTCFKLNKASMHATVKGDEALGLGGMSGDTEIRILNADSSVNLVTKLEHRDYLVKEKVEITGGRSRFIVNGHEYKYDPK
ncbi:MAG: EAL domain-containing protein [Oscillospiraceae bacterium]|nr:EAL domain-containing protein [Oscillospiraceae bacterium]